MLISNKMPMNGRPLGPGRERSPRLRALLCQALSAKNASKATEAEHRVGVEKSILEHSGLELRSG